MKTKSLITILILYCLTTFNMFSQEFPIYADSQLTTGFEIGVDTDKGEREWISEMDGFLKLEYPSNQAWGAVFITKGKSTNQPRPFQNFSAYSKLIVEMRGENGGETLNIGIKDNTDPDNGRETKKQIAVKKNWETYELLLSEFKTANLSKIYVVIEFVFNGSTGKTVYFKNVRYKK